jgi:hypothetical protein
MPTSPAALARGTVRSRRKPSRRNCRCRSKRRWSGAPRLSLGHAVLGATGGLVLLGAGSASSS